MDFNKLMEQAQAMQKRMEKEAEQLTNTEFVGSASNGLVRVTLNGDYKMLKAELDPSILNAEDKEMIEDLIVIAMNNAVAQVTEAKESQAKKMLGGMKLPGM